MDIEHFSDDPGGVTAISALAFGNKGRIPWAASRYLVGMADPLDFASGKDTAPSWVEPFLIQLLGNLVIALMLG